MQQKSAFDALPSLKDVIAEHDLAADKSLGQNFILDQNITDKIVRFAPDLETSHVVEIGPGPGGLTRSILKQNPISLVAVEFDERAVKALQSLKRAADGKLNIVQMDAKEFDYFAHVKTPRQVIANLPYNIATHLLLGWLKMISEDYKAFDALTLMFQEEVADRITASVDTKAYGRISVITQWLCHVEKVYRLPPSAFTPAPKVHSAIVQLKPKKNLIAGPSFSMVETLTALAFGQRRKMIRSSLKTYRDFFAAAHLDETLRAENLAPEDFIRLADVIEKA